MAELWDPDQPGVLRLPSGRLVRGRSLRRSTPPDPPPMFAVYLRGKPPPDVPWESRWVRWPEFWLPSDRSQARDAFAEAWVRAGEERVEIACDGGLGRTGTALACLAIIDGVSADLVVSFVRRNYDRRAIETPWQRRYAERFTKT